MYLLFSKYLLITTLCQVLCWAFNISQLYRSFDIISFDLYSILMWQVLLWSTQIYRWGNWGSGVFRNHSKMLSVRHILLTPPSEQWASQKIFTQDRTGHHSLTHLFIHSFFYLFVHSAACNCVPNSVPGRMESLISEKRQHYLPMLDVYIYIYMPLSDCWQNVDPSA